jgi:uncharacterized 2Fe-2S/4Fe-4S cluster protein (DUF4445 family)
MNIIFTDYEKEAKLVKGRTILSYLHELEIDINCACGGEGKCGQCLVEVECILGALSEITEKEHNFIHDDIHRLACQARIEKIDNPIYVRVPKRIYFVLESGEYKEIPLEPFVHIEGERVFYESEDIGEYTGELYGIALDIGTTTLAMYLIDLESGQVLYVLSRENPQLKYGNNVISRIEFARDRQKVLEREIRAAVNEMIRAMVDPKRVYELVVVGNPVMRDLFFGYSVESLGKSPYEPLRVQAIRKTAKELGLKANSAARVYGLPLIGSFVGADALAVVLATGMNESDELCLAIDIGTNTEIVLGSRFRLIATSCAAGPAFEGAGIPCGLGGVTGAIKEVKIEKGEVRYRTIGDTTPVGVCGSGLIDTLAELLERRIIDGRGKFLGDKKEFEIVEGFNLSERDIDQLNLAKTAVAVGIKTLMRNYGVALDEIDSIFLAGAFGNFINIENAVRIGLLPPVDREKVKKVGNAALEGARQALISRPKREEAEAVAKRIEHVKLEEEKDFMEKFVSELYFQHYL